MRAKLQIFRSEERYRFFPSQNIYFYDLEWSPQKRHNHRIMSQNDCIMSVLTTCNLLCMRDIALVVGAVLITFFWQKHIWYWFNRKKMSFHLFGASLKVFDYFWWCFVNLKSCGTRTPKTYYYERELDKKQTSGSLCELYGWVSRPRRKQLFTNFEPQNG